MSDTTETIETTERTETTQDDGPNPLRRARDAVVVAQAVSELHDAIDFENLRADDTVGDPVDVDQLADAIGRPIGRLIALRLVDDSGATGFAKRSITEHVGRTVSAQTFRVVVENVDTEAVAETLVELDEETLPGPSLSEHPDSEMPTDDRRV
jgi:hypothetical protein